MGLASQYAARKKRTGVRLNYLELCALLDAIPHERRAAPPLESGRNRLQKACSRRGAAIARAR